MKKPKIRHPAGTIIQASDRQYRVNERGEFRHLEHEIKGVFVPPPPKEFHRDGMSFDGSKCWCSECIAWRKKI